MKRNIQIAFYIGWTLIMFPWLLGFRGLVYIVGCVAIKYAYNLKLNRSVKMRVKALKDMPGIREGRIIEAHKYDNQWYIFVGSRPELRYPVRILVLDGWVEEVKESLAQKIAESGIAITGPLGWTNCGEIAKIAESHHFSDEKIAKAKRMVMRPELIDEIVSIFKGV